ncbi:pseudouridine synthase [Lichenihabitans sp. Uapishka_5]|uniref:pseudouridine synthase n=1 Tax=Lichenihabitans sp. Uapishka_5 TaxID=3037302 RepID=UPI0029E7CD82|nr:pseudouridine synthase [Lichenihabitans sp. Uapishka_5]MDX7952462.1 pseudouridine synthase [Lichenihabitans sp. Uapishka_5]
MRLDKLLSNLGYGSRREIPALLRAGRVRLGELRLSDAAQKIASAAWTEIRIDGEPLDPPPGLVIMMHKPLGVTCSHKDEGPLVHELLPERWRRREPQISSVGRLDKDTSGLLLMTDDGPLLHSLIAPKAQVPKRYHVKLARPLRGDETETFAAGTLMLQGDETPLRMARLDVTSPTRAALTITEGRYHQVRRMFAAVGNHVLALHRDQVGGLTLPDDLAPGQHRVLDEAQVKTVLSPPRTAAANR